MFENGSGWGVDFFSYEVEGLIFKEQYRDRSTGEMFDPQFNVLSLSKLYNKPFSLGYVDVGLGLGVGKGSWGEKCEDEPERFLSRGRLCDEKDGYQLGIPLQASFAFGKYVGIGVSANVFITKDFTESRVMLTIPFGSFTR